MKKFTTLATCLISTYFLFAQKTIPEFGKIDLSDLQLKSCSFEPDAPALKLFDVQDVEFKVDPYSSRLITERRVRIKIFNQEGYKFASVKIPYYSKRGVTKMKDLGGVVYSLDATGNITIQKLEKKDFFKEKSEQNLGILNFTFPNLKPGSIVEFRYTKIEKNLIDIDPWTAQDEIPTQYTSITIKMPIFSSIREKIYGLDSIVKKSVVNNFNANWTQHSYYGENIRSFRAEPFMIDEIVLRRRK
ncbi:MAG TPA: DUF3857 domain-containing protein [Chitinophagaceae bacterium]|jgi:hypothetical protein